MSSLETERLILRRWRIDEDLDAFARINADPRVMEFFPRLFSREETRESIGRIEACIEKNGFGFWACERKSDGKLLGFVGLHEPLFEAPFMPCVEIGWRLAYEAWGQGYAPEAARRALEFGFREKGLKEIVSFTAAVNLRSIRVMEKIGMRRDPEGDFDHPRVPEGNHLRHHVLYRIQNK